MPTIKLLSDDVINNISAGEIIERPASVVKELTENSLDSGANRIKIEIKKGGTKLIRVSDNGSGIPEKEVPVALQRHATSKITSMEDLERINSLGFRGEALPSIAAVSCFTMSTRTSSSDTGCMLKSSGNRDIDIQKTGCPEGTTVLIENLFFNTPARLKFLKSNSTETLHIIGHVQQIALSHPQISFELKDEGRIISGPLPEGQTLKQRIASLYGSKLIDNLITFHSENNFVKLSGYLTKPLLNYPNSKHQFIFVNKRPIKSRLINHAIMNGYGSLLENRRYPGIFLFIDIKPEFIDVNIHPTKKEVRFLNENAIHGLVAETIRKFLKQKEVIAEIRDNSSYRKAESTRDGRIKDALGDYIFKNKPSFKTSSKKVFSHRERFNYSGKQEKFEEQLTGTAVPLAQINNTYIIAQESDGMLIIDQHAAWERINYEIIKARYEKHEISSQALLIPINLELPPQNIKILKGNPGFFTKMGFDISDFGPNSFIIKATPALFEDKVNYKQLLSDILDLLSESSGAIDIESGVTELIDSVFKIMACRSSVKAGDKLSITEMEELIKRLNNCSIPYSCPHGRPTMIKLSTNELEKRFKRR